MSDDELSRRLRDSLRRHAADAPSDDLIAERIIRAADRPAPRPVRRQRLGWAWPATIAAVIIVLVGVVLAVTQLGPSHPHAQPALGASQSRTAPTTAARPATTAERSSAPPSTPDSDSATTVAPPVRLHAVRIVDLTFDSVDSGWALASARCVTDPARRCTALLHTDDGTTWQSRPGAEFNVDGVTGGCADPCVTSIRFATENIGYAFGPSAFFLTTDGGVTWQRQPGGALALETADGNVIRVVRRGAAVVAQVAPNGSRTWATHVVISACCAGPSTFDLGRSGSTAYLLEIGRSTSSLYRTGDDGRSWRGPAAPCPRNVQISRAHSLAVGPGDRIVVACTMWRGILADRLSVSVDGGRTFALRGPTDLGDVSAIAGDPAGVLILAGRDTQLLRSTDGGSHLTRVPEVHGRLGFVGFESPTVGRVVTGDNIIWTTRDGGRTWHAVPLG